MPVRSLFRRCRHNSDLETDGSSIFVQKDLAEFRLEKHQNNRLLKTNKTYHRIFPENNEINLRKTL